MGVISVLMEESQIQRKDVQATEEALYIDVEKVRVNGKPRRRRAHQSMAEEKVSCSAQELRSTNDLRHLKVYDTPNKFNNPNQTP